MSSRKGIESGRRKKIDAGLSRVGRRLLSNRLRLFAYICQEVEEISQNQMRSRNGWALEVYDETEGDSSGIRIVWCDVCWGH